MCDVLRVLPIKDFLHTSSFNIPNIFSHVKRTEMVVLHYGTDKKDRRTSSLFYRREHPFQHRVEFRVVCLQRAGLLEKIFRGNGEELLSLVAP